MKIDHALSAARHSAASLSTEATALQAAGSIWLRRLAFWAPVAATTAAGTVLGVMATAGTTSPFRWPLLVLLAANLFYLALTGMPAIIGFALHATRRKFRPAAQPSGLSRTALLMPIHNENPAAVFAAIEVMARAVADAGLGRTDIFVLSDTQDMGVAAEEEAAFALARARAPAGLGLHYRRRPSNAGRKSGNLAEFCERWGDGYDYMLVLDADSLMGARSIATLIGLMDASPHTGIIQTVPYAVGRDTLFARLQQFSARLYSPLLVEGLTFWQQSDGNYWGHNAIIRIAPFRAHCTLPVLPGREPWGGEILCHDVVEAGLMRGAGWGVWVLPEVMESYEASPVNLVDFASRERRWCQGNLQHKGVVGLPGFRPVGRFHLSYGIAHYLAGPVVAAFLALVSIDAAMGGTFGRSLLHGPAAWWLIGLSASLLYLGKLTSLGAALIDREEAWRYGGRWALLGSALLEQLAVFVLSPLLIMAYTRYLVELICGKAVRWDAQPRDDRGVGWHEAWLRTRLCVFTGLGWALLLPAMPLELRLWAMPLLLGLLATWPMTVWSSRTSLGRLARRWRLLLTPEEVAPPSIVRLTQRALGTTAADPVRSSEPGLSAPALPSCETT